MRAEFPEKLQFLFDPARYKVAYGGRGGAKSWGFSRALLIQGAMGIERILCTREFQNSIRESVHHLLAMQVEMLGLEQFYSVNQTEIRGANGTEFIFSGIASNPTKIKSMEGITKCWVEEAERVSEDSWKILIPTIRQEGSEIWVSFNPDKASDATYRRFILSAPPGAAVVSINWRDNPWFPEELRKEKDYLARVDFDAYMHIWEGGINERSNSLVLGGKCAVKDFEVGLDWDGPYFGADWGFSQDPSVLVKSYIHDHKLYVRNEAWGIGVEIDKTPELFDRVPDSRKHVIRADSSRPETISYLRRRGFQKLRGAEQWSGSVEDGVAFLRSFEQIVIHPDCRHMIDEANTYSYKRDRLNGDILTDIVDASNHVVDALRYSLEPICKAGNMGFFEWAKEEAERLREQREARA
jgi:phage terminase large subunit